MHFIGIDPGKGGGIAVVDEVGGIVYYTKMPQTERDVLDLFAKITEDGTRRARAVLERVNAGVFGGKKQGRMGVVSAFSFGKGYGTLRTALVAREIVFDEVAPVNWQTAMNCRTKGDKNVSKRRAQELFPNVKVTHAIADALLIAECCRRMAAGRDR